MDIDWGGIAEDLGMQEEDAEAVIHEMAHVYDCGAKSKVFEHVGKQTEVGDLIRATYPDNFTQNLSEIRVSAITYLVLGRLDLLTDELKKEVLHSLLGNLRSGPYGSRSGAREMFEEWLVSPPKTMLEAVDDIAGWIQAY